MGEARRGDARGGGGGLVMRRTIPRGLLLCALAGLSGCAAIWGFDELRQGDGGFDASVQDAPSADDSTTSETGMDGDDGSVFDTEGIDAADAVADGRVEEDASDAAARSDGAVEAGSDCPSICTTQGECCNDAGKCVKGTTAACAPSSAVGAACIDCNAVESCSITTGGVCCKSTGGCACAPLLGGCN
ncbi:MAG TPA: hypothetical protein VH044_12600 [Polyangiaceae bacterium]|nr:hypothetical protein [Polyangiaceae bacterium]